jgi:hypothetical protein
LITPIYRARPPDLNVGAWWETKFTHCEWGNLAPHHLLQAVFIDGSQHLEGGE